MFREQLRQVFGFLKRALRIEQRLTLQESYGVLDISEEIAHYVLMIQEYEHSVSFVVVEVPELASRFRETPRAIKDGLLILEHRGLADQVAPGYWRLKVADTLRTDAGAA
jgi:hypothetical protein